MVSPMPSASRMPSPAALLTVPARSVPASVIAEVERVLEPLREEPVGPHRHGDVVRLERDLDLPVALVLQEADVALGALHHPLGGGPAVLLHDVLLERAGVHADADRDPPLAGGLDHLAHPLARADVAGVEADAVDAGVERAPAPAGSRSGCRPPAAPAWPRTMAGSAAAASWSGTATRTTSAPASASAPHLRQRRRRRRRSGWWSSTGPRSARRRRWPRSPPGSAASAGARRATRPRPVRMRPVTSMRPERARGRRPQI